MQVVSACRSRCRCRKGSCLKAKKGPAGNVLNGFPLGHFHRPGLEPVAAQPSPAIVAIPSLLASSRNSLKAERRQVQFKLDGVPDGHAEEPEGMIGTPVLFR